VIDWFVVLTPLLLLPVFLPFVFVGCALNSHGAPAQPVRLTFGEGVGNHVDSVTVMFTFTPSGAPAPTLAAIETLTGGEISAADSMVDKTDEFAMHKQPPGDLICTCTITKKDTLEEVTKALGQKHDMDAGTILSIFELTTDGDSFEIGFLAGEVVYVGGW
jgi:hypothetical protein